jgi:hypothetical protein
MMFPQFPMPHAQMDMSWMVLTSFLWWLLAAIAVVALLWLVVTLARADARAERALEDLLVRGRIDGDEYHRRLVSLESR